MKFLITLVLASAVLLAGCATRQIHAVNIGMPGDPSNFELLAYDYTGTFKYPYPNMGPDPRPKKGAQFLVNVSKVDYIDLKWRVKSTGKVYSAHVNLRGLLPSSDEKFVVHPVIDGNRLSIYVSFEHQMLVERDPSCPPYHGRNRCKRIFFKEMEQ